MKHQLVLSLIAVVATCGLLSNSSAHAAITSVSGSGQHVPISTDVSFNQFESELVSGFDELQNVSVAANTLKVDFLISAGDVGSQFPGANLPPNSPTYLGAGSYSSHLLHYDPVGDAGVGGVATFTFDGDVVGIIANTTYLVESDASVGVPTTTYETSEQRRYESFNGTGDPDLFTIVSSNSVSIDYAYVAFGYLDDLRVITAHGTDCAVPEPSTYAMAGLGLLGLLAYRRFR